MEKFLIIIPAVIALITLLFICFKRLAGKSSTNSSESEPLVFKTSVDISEKSLTVIGRVKIENKVIELNWTNSGFTFSFIGTGAKIRMDSAATNSDHKPYVSVFVDGELKNNFEISKPDDYLLCENLPYAEHQVAVIKITEPIDAPLLALQLEIISVDKSGEVMAPPSLPQRKIQFVGDSITCGYGNLGKSSDSGFRTSEEGGLQTYAALTVKHFGADAHYICASGKGIIKDCNGNSAEPLPEIYDLMKIGSEEKWNHDSWNPDIVIINAGTNDCPGGVSESDFSKGVLDFLKKVRNHNKNAQIIWCYGMMNQKYNAVLEETIAMFSENDKNAHYLQLQAIKLDLDEVGSEGHPNLKAHKKAGGLLIEKIEACMGW